MGCNSMLLSSATYATPVSCGYIWQTQNCTVNLQSNRAANLRKRLHLFLEAVCRVQTLSVVFMRFEETHDDSAVLLLQVCWEKFNEYFEVEGRYVAVEIDYPVMSAERIEQYADENTIGKDYEAHNILYII